MIARGPGAAGQRTDGPRRIYIVGGEASGKTTLARVFGDRLGVPIHQLDSVAWRGVTGPDRPMFEPGFQPTDDLVPRALTERIGLVAEIAADDSWIAEGKHIGWTEELARTADLVIWLDHVPFRTAALRILRRALRSRRRTMTTGPGRRRAIRWRNYVVRSRQLYRQLRELRSYYRAKAGQVEDPDDELAVTRAATATVLAPYRRKLKHVRAAVDLDRVVDQL